MARCRKIYVSCKGEDYTIPYYRTVHRGFSCCGCEVVFSSPTKCFLTPSTEIDYVEKCSYNISEYKDNIIIEEACSERSKSIYVYPKKVYETVRKLYIEPMIENKTPFNTGLILTGSPGTGKSSLARIISKIIGVSVFTISPDTILSKYVGDSEKALSNTIYNAIMNEPSVIILDDAEWILSPRKLSGGEDGVQAYTNLKNILFNSMQEIYNNGYKVLFIASTNIKESEIDPAFIRQGRFGKPLFIPLPDYDAVKIVLSNMIGEEKAKSLARKIVNMGLSLADAVGVAERIRYGLEEDIKPQGGRGYARIHVEQVDYSKLFEYYNKKIFKGRSRIYLHGNEDVMGSIATQISYNVGSTVIKMVDIRYYDEAVHTANMFNSNMIVSSNTHPEVLQYIDKNLERSLFIVGKVPPNGVESIPLFSIEYLYKIIGKEKILRSVLYYKGIEFEDDIILKAVNTVTDNDMFTKLLELVSSLSYIGEDIINRIPP